MSTGLRAKNQSSKFSFLNRKAILIVVLLSAGLSAPVCIAAGLNARQFLIFMVFDLLLGAGAAAYIQIKAYSDCGRSAQQVAAALKQMVQDRDISRHIEKGNGTDSLELAAYFNMFVDMVRQTISSVYQTAHMINRLSEALLAKGEVVAGGTVNSSMKVNQMSEAFKVISSNMGISAETLTETGKSMKIISSAVEEMTGTIRSLAAASEQTSVGAGQITEIVSQISGGINSVTDSAKDVSSSVNSVATAVKEINLSLNEVNKNCERSINITSDAETKARDTNRIIEKLDSSSKQIGQIINVINDIADQTNMLALNAAIEAAGAGEAGKGFAVVANEVKELAKQTSEATDEIGQQIEAMQESTREAVKAVGVITEVIREITVITGTIAAAVTEQSATTGDISSAVVKAAQRVSQITKEIEELANNTLSVTKTLSEATRGATEVARSASEISASSNQVAESAESASTRLEQAISAILAGNGEAASIAGGMDKMAEEAAVVAEEAGKSLKSAEELREFAQKLLHQLMQHKY